MIRFAVLLAVMLATNPGVAGDLPDVESVLDRFVEAVGGREALEAVDRRWHRGTIVQDLAWKDPSHSEKPFLAVADAEGHVRYAEVAEWSELPKEDDADLRSKLRWIFHPRFALVVEEFFPKLNVDRREVRDGRPVVVLVLQELRPEYFSLYFDEESDLLTHIGHHNRLEDWREANGVLFPHRWVFGRKGGHTTYVWESIEAGTPGNVD